MVLGSIFRSYTDLRHLIENLDYHKDPRGSLEKIIAYAKKYPKIDNQLKGTKTYEVILKMEETAKQEGWTKAAQNGLKDFGVNYRLIGKENIPNLGSSIYFVNHPYGILDSLVLIGGLGEELETKGKKLMLLGTHKLKMINGIENIVFFVDIDNFSHNGFRDLPVKPNTAYIRKLIDYLDHDGHLGVFPSRGLSGAKLKEGEWTENCGKLSRYADSSVPMWFNGPDHGFLYNNLGKINPYFKALATLAEAWNKKGETIDLVIGKPILKENLSGMQIKNLTSYLRQECERLKFGD